MTGDSVTLFEMAPRDGLQSESVHVPTETKIELIDRLSGCGLRWIETGSFVSPKWVPQMADSKKVFAGITREPGVRYTALTPNLQGWEAAWDAGADEVAIFASASESFSQRNLNCDIATSLSRFAPVLEAATQAGVPVRGYVSCILGCPYEGEISQEAVIVLTEKLLEAGCYQVSLGDTIGTGTPGRTGKLLKALAGSVSLSKIAMHMHDTYGQAVGNIYASLEAGVRVFDASVGGLGGCPYAKGATGNVATEDIAYLFDREGLNHGLDLLKLSETGCWINQQLNKETQSRAGRALLNRAAL